MSRYAPADEGVFAGYGQLANLDEVREWLDERDRHARSADRIRYALAVTLKSSGEVIGTTRIHIEDAWDRVGSLGYGIRSEYRLSGYAIEAARLAVGFGFTKLGLHRIEALVDPGNLPSQRIVEKLGMRREGLLKERLRERDGYRDAGLYALNEDDIRR